MNQSVPQWMMIVPGCQNGSFVTESLQNATGNIRADSVVLRQSDGRRTGGELEANGRLHCTEPIKYGK